MPRAPEIVGGADRFLSRETIDVPFPLYAELRARQPIKFRYRVVCRACELAGYELVPGDRLMLLWASANRDESVFDDADALRLDPRFPKHHMAFGRGNHFCVGATLARLEAESIVAALLVEGPSLRIRPGATPRFGHSIFARRLEALEIDFAS